VSCTKRNQCPVCAVVIFHGLRSRYGRKVLLGYHARTSGAHPLGHTNPLHGRSPTAKGAGIPWRDHHVMREHVSLCTSCRIVARFQYCAQDCHRELEETRFIVCPGEGLSSPAAGRVLGTEVDGVADAMIAARLVTPVHHRKEEHDVRANAGDHCR